MWTAFVTTLLCAGLARAEDGDGYGRLDLGPADEDERSTDAPAPPSDPVYTLGVRDVLLFELVGEGEDMRKELEVLANGAVDVPLAGPVPVAGKSLGQATLDVTSALAAGYYVNPQVRLEILRYRSQPVIVRGAVAKPGTYFLEGPTTVSEIISLAGSVVLEHDSAVTEARILRSVSGTPTTLTVDLERIFSGSGEDEDMWVRAGDTIHVPRVEAIFVQGEVKEAGAVAFREGMSASQALSQVGGHASTANLAAAYVLRNGERIPLNLRKVLKGKASDVVLQPGDQLFVPESPF